MKKLLLLAVFILTAVLFSACSTQTLFKADPHDEQEIYNVIEIENNENDEYLVSV